MEHRRVPGPAPWTLVLVLVLQRAVQASAQQQVPVSTGAQLVSALQSALSSPDAPATRVILDPSVSVQGQNFSSALTAPPPGNLSLSVSGQGDRTATILDAGMRGYLVPAIQAPSSLALSQFTAINLCCETRWWNQTAGYSYITAAGFYLFGPESAQAGRPPAKQFQSLVLFVPQLEILMYIYWALIQTTPFTALTSMMSSYLDPAINFQPLASAMSPFSITYQSAVVSGIQYSDVQLRAVNDPNITADFKRSFLPAQYCNGSTVNSALDYNALNTLMFPLYLARDSASLQDSLSAAGLYTQTKSQTDPAAIIFLTGSMVLGGERGQYAAVTLRAECLLHGPLRSPRSAPPQARLNMGLVPNILQLAWRGRLYMAHLVLDQLILGALDNGGYTSALPLWSINLVTRASPQVFLDTVTLSLPLSDYLALLAAAMRGPAWKTGAVTTAPLMNGIDAFELQPGFVPTTSTTSIPVKAYQGWGLNGVNITFNISSTANYSLPLTLPDVSSPPQAQSTSKEGQSNAMALGLGLGLGIGLGVTAVGAVAAFVIIRRRKRYKADEKDGKGSPGPPSGKGAPPPPGPRGPSANGHAPRGPKDTTGSPAGSVAINMSNGSGMSQKRANGVTADVNGTEPPSKGSMRGSRTASSSAEANGMSAATGVLQAVANKSGLHGKAQPLEANHLNVAALRAAVKAKQTGSLQGGGGVGVPYPEGAASPLSGNTSAGRSGSDTITDPKRAVQQAVGQLGNMEADKLTLLGVLGRGTWGTVYKGQWRNLDVAVKTVLFSDRTDGKGSLPHERAIMEAAVCTSVAHRNVVATYHYDIKPVIAVEEGQGLQVAASTAGMDLLTTEWKLYLVQEWCQTSVGAAMRSGALHDPITRQPMLDLLITVLMDLTAGLTYLHDKHIIHGDLKPENIMLKMDQSAPTGVVAKITDFGLSTTLGPTATHVSNFNSGTPFYVAPEVVAEGRVTKGSDIYSLGVVMWELYHGSQPWVKDKAGAYSLHPSFAQFPPSAPKPYASLAQRCAQRDWRVRPALSTVVSELQAMHAAWLAGFDSLEMGVPSHTQTAPTSASTSTSGAASAGGIGQGATATARAHAHVAALPQAPVQATTSQASQPEIVAAPLDAPAGAAPAPPAPVSTRLPSRMELMPFAIGMGGRSGQAGTTGTAGTSASKAAGSSGEGSGNAAAVPVAVNVLPKPGVTPAPAQVSNGQATTTSRARSGMAAGLGPSRLSGSAISPAPITAPDGTRPGAVVANGAGPQGAANIKEGPHSSSVSQP